MPAVHIRDNLDLLPSAYRITLMGVAIGEGEVFIDKFMAINPGQVFGTLQGSKPKIRHLAWMRFGWRPTKKIKLSPSVIPW